MNDSCSYTHDAAPVAGWSCPHPPTEGERCPLHTDADVSTEDLSRFVDTEAVRTDSGTVPAIGTTVAEIAVGGLSHPLDLRGSETAVVAEPRTVVPRLEL